MEFSIKNTVTTSEIIDTIKLACKESKIVKARLQDEPAVRIIHPFGVCLTTKRELIIVCWQIGGYTKSGALPQYRNIMINDCVHAEMMAQTFKVHAAFNPDSKQYDTWLFHVKGIGN